VQQILTAINLDFLDWSRYFFIQVAPQLSSRGWLNGPGSRPLTAPSALQTENKQSLLASGCKRVNVNGTCASATEVQQISVVHKIHHQLILLH
jgi:hypothetical protein